MANMNARHTLEAKYVELSKARDKKKNDLNTLKSSWIIMKYMSPIIR